MRDVVMLNQPSETYSKLSTRLGWLLLAGGLFLLDLVSKEVVLAHLRPTEILELGSYLNFTLVFNTGAAFSLLHAAGGWQEGFFISVALLVSLTICYWQLSTSGRQTGLRCATALVLGGTLGNLYDRVNYGMVIDFIQFHINSWFYPTFNLADAAISVGAVLLILLLFKSDKA